MKKESKIFYVGKGISKTDDTRSPLEGAPNSNIDFYRKADGKFHRRRKIGKFGYAVKDYDMPDLHKSAILVHEYNGLLRGEDRVPTKRELREINKANKKRRFWR